MTTSAPVKKKRIFLIDDHAVLRDALSRLIDEQEDLAVVGGIAEARAAIAALGEEQPDLAIVDISLPGADGIELIKNIRAHFPDLGIIVLSMHDESLYAERALRAGARGYVMKSAPGAQFLAAIRTVLRGEVHLSENLSSHLLKSIVSQKQRPLRALEQLSDRELEVLRLLGQGYTTREIATSLRISTKTVESHRGNIRGKLSLPTGAELMRFALAHREETV